jgi:lipopolysaccharide export system protein LptA
VIFSPGIFFTKAGNVSAQTDNPAGVRDIHVIADSMTSERDRAFVTFTGNAIATSEEIVIKADAIDVFFYTQDEKDSRVKINDQDNNQGKNKTSNKNNDQSINQNIKEIIATGNVIFTSQEHRASADRAVYNTTTERLVLTGEAPRVTTGKSYVTGKKITLFQKNGKVIVEGGKNQRVEALFNDSDSKSATKPDIKTDTKSVTKPNKKTGTKSATKKDKEVE